MKMININYEIKSKKTGNIVIKNLGRFSSIENTKKELMEQYSPIRYEIKISK